MSTIIMCNWFKWHSKFTNTFLYRFIFRAINISIFIYFNFSQLNDLDKIRESCELFSSQFPLAPEIWTKWLQIELTIATSEAELKRLHGLFKRALADYFCMYPFSPLLKSAF